jgi:hypothetical protein
MTARNPPVPQERDCREGDCQGTQLGVPAGRRESSPPLQWRGRSLKKDPVPSGTTECTREKMVFPASGGKTAKDGFRKWLLLSAVPPGLQPDCRRSPASKLAGYSHPVSPRPGIEVATSRRPTFARLDKAINSSRIWVAPKCWAPSGEENFSLSACVSGRLPKLLYFLRLPRRTGFG